MSTENFGNTEILQIIDAVSKDRNIPRSTLLKTMEQAIQIAGRKKYGVEHDIVAKIDPKTGKINLYRARKIVEKVNDTLTEISLEDALENNPEAKIDETVLELLPPIDLGRIAAKTAKQVIVQKVSEIEREKEYEDFKNRKGEILSGIVKRMEFNNVIVEIGRNEAVLRKNQQIRGETYQIGDRIKAYVQDVRQEVKGPQIFLSRTDNNFLQKLFEIEVPEIYDNIIEIKAIAREPGSKAKIAVTATDVSIDPVGSCVGVRGSRVRNISNELNGEKIDVVNWDSNVVQFIINALSPAEISKIVFNDAQNKVEAIIPEDKLSLAIGKRGQNVKLASQLTGFNIDVITEEEESNRRSAEFSNTTSLFIEILNVEEVVAQLLSVEGYNSVEQIAYANLDDLAAIEGFNEELAQNLKERAVEYVEKQNEDIIQKLEDLGVEQDLLDILDLPPEYILKLAEYGIKSTEDLVEMTVEEFSAIVPENVMDKDSIVLLLDFVKKQEQNED